MWLKSFSFAISRKKAISTLQLSFSIECSRRSYGRHMEERRKKTLQIASIKSFHLFSTAQNHYLTHTHNFVAHRRKNIGSMEYTWIIWFQTCCCTIEIHLLDENIKNLKLMIQSFLLFGVKPIFWLDICVCSFEFEKLNQ